MSASLTRGPGTVHTGGGDVPNLAAVRRSYAEELRAVAGLRSEALVEAFATVPRERFLGPGPWEILAMGDPGGITYRTTVNADPRHLYRDVLVAIDAGRLLNNGQPSSLAGWFGALDLRPGETVVHIGCGTGYYTAILAEVVRPAGRVVAIEIDPELARRARDNLASWRQVDVLEGDGAVLDSGAADAIFVNGGVTHPRAVWIDSLRPEGRLLVPITASANTSGTGWGGMFMITRRLPGFEVRFLSPVVIFPCLGARDPALNEDLSNKGDDDGRSVRSLRREPHERDETCWLHAEECCLSRLPPA